MRGPESLLAQAARLTELAGHQVDGSFVVRLERRVPAAPDRIQTVWGRGYLWTRTGGRDDDAGE